MCLIEYKQCGASHYNMLNFILPPPPPHPKKKKKNYNSVVKNAYSQCHKDACVLISYGNTEWLLPYTGISYTCFSSKKACFHQEHWLGKSSRPRIGTQSQQNMLTVHIYCDILCFRSWESYYLKQILWQPRISRFYHTISTVFSCS